jgi:hypothetical protein
MTPSARPLCLLAAFACLGGGPPVDASWDDVNRAFKKLEQADEDWRAEQAACEELARGGDMAADVVRQAAENHENTRIRRACYKLLTHEFARNPWALPTVIRAGLSDKDSGIRYENAFQLGELKAYDSFRELKRVLSTERCADT